MPIKNGHILTGVTVLITVISCTRVVGIIPGSSICKMLAAYLPHSSSFPRNGIIRKVLPLVSQLYLPRSALHTASLLESTVVKRFFFRRFSNPNGPSLHAALQSISKSRCACLSDSHSSFLLVSLDWPLSPRFMYCMLGYIVKKRLCTCKTTLGF